MNPQHFTIMVPKIAQHISESASPSKFPSYFSAEIHRMFGSDFFHILFITFLCSELLFMIVSVSNRRIQRIITLLLGAIFGATLIHTGSTVDGVVQGLLSGISSIVIVSRFGSKNNVSCQCEKNAEKCIIPSHPEHL